MRLLGDRPGLLKHPIMDRVADYVESLLEGTQSAADDLRARLYRGEMSIVPEQFTILGGRFAMRREQDRAKRRHLLFPRLMEMEPPRRVEK